jgi:hypothetical protein
MVLMAFFPGFKRFAAEIFHGLHEEVMTTAARGHGLMARVQQLEAEFPSIEKAFLSQTNHSPFFSSSGLKTICFLKLLYELLMSGIGALIRWKYNLAVSFLSFSVMFPTLLSSLPR